MTKLNLKLLNPNIEPKLQNPYTQWRNYQKKTEQNYIMLPTELIKYLTEIKSKAVNLYLYYFFKSKNKTGDSWYAVNTLAKEFDVTSKTINNWNKELEQLGLIARVNENKSSTTTYILPISDFYYIENSLSVDQFLKTYNEQKEGTLKGIFNMFQWRQETKDDKTKTYTKPYNTICLLFEYIGKTNEGQTFKTIKGIFFPQSSTQELNLHAEEFTEDMYKFDSPILKELSSIKTESVEKYGLAISTKLNLLEPANQEVTDLLVQIDKGIENLEKLPETEIITTKN